MERCQPCDLATEETNSKERGLSLFSQVFVHSSGNSARVGRIDLAAKVIHTPIAPLTPPSGLPKPDRARHHVVTHCVCHHDLPVPGHTSRGGFTGSAQAGCQSTVAMERGTHRAVVTQTSPLTQQLQKAYLSLPLLLPPDATFRPPPAL